MPSTSIDLQNVHIYIKELNHRLKALQNNQNKIVEQSSSFLEKDSLGALKVSLQDSSNLIPPLLDQRTRSTKVKELVSTFENSSELKSNFNISTHKSFDELQKLNTILKDKIIKLMEKFEVNLKKKSDNFSNDEEYISLYELNNTNLKRVESLHLELQDAKVIYEKRSYIDGVEVSGSNDSESLQ